MKKQNQQRQKVLQKKREKHNLSRKGKTYNPAKRYYRVEHGKLVPTDANNTHAVSDNDVITL